MFLKNRNISSKIKRSKVTDYAALSFNYKELFNVKKCVRVTLSNNTPEKCMRLTNSCATFFECPVECVLSISIA